MILSSFLSSAEHLELQICVLSQRKDHGVARRANTILLLNNGKSCQVIAEFLYLDNDTIRGWHKTYRESGWDALAFDGWKGGQSRKSADQKATLCGWLSDRFCRSTVGIRAHISKEFGLRYSHFGCIKLLARLGFEHHKPKALPRVAFTKKQANFISMYQTDDWAWYGWSRLFFRCSPPRISDKACIRLGKSRLIPAVPTTAGRGRVNTHGAVTLETFDAPTIVDGVSAAQLLAQIEACNPDKRLIHVIWDNAAYNKGPDVRKFLARQDCRIHLIQLPRIALTWTQSNGFGLSCNNTWHTIDITPAKNSSRMRSYGSFAKLSQMTANLSRFRCQITSGSSTTINFRFWGSGGIIIIFQSKQKGQLQVIHTGYSPASLKKC